MVRPIGQGTLVDRDRSDELGTGACTLMSLSLSAADANTRPSGEYARKSTVDGIILEFWTVYGVSGGRSRANSSSIRRRLTSESAT